MSFFSRGKSVSTDEDAIGELLTRGVEAVIPRELAEKKLRSGERLRIYLGIDPTGAKLHIGHSVPLRKLKQFCDLGHEVVFLVGSFTAMIGDPTGRDAAREPLTNEQVRENFKHYKKQAEKVLDFSNVTVRYNDEWLAPLTLEGLVKLASNFTVGQMIQRDMFQTRMKEGKPISLHEFLYPLMVGYDSVVLDVDCELGGSDQEFNMLAGRQLQQATGGREKFVLTTKLIAGTDGRKMSKTFNNCVYLEDEPADMYGKVMSLKDELIKIYLDVCTNFSKENINSTLALPPKEAKMRLAREIVKMYHSEEAAEKAERSWVETFSQGGVPENIQELNSLGLLKDTLVKNGVVASNSEFGRLLSAGAITRIDEDAGENKITDAGTPASSGGIYRVGKHRFVKVK
jgi:tyrosyl-tRNA synthetase